MGLAFLIGVEVSILLLLVSSVPVFPLALGFSVPVICLGSFGPWRAFFLCVSLVSAFIFAACSPLVSDCVVFFCWHRKGAVIPAVAGVERS